MDVRDVTDQYYHLIARQKDVLERAKGRHGQRPRDRRSRSEAYARFMLSLTLRAGRSNTFQIHSSFIPPTYPPCIADVADLRRIFIRDLRLETHHRGSYLMLRSITPPSRMTAVMALMEDEEGEVAVMQLYQQEDDNVREATDIVDVGTILMVKEPYFKVTGDGEYGLRVDHLSDLIQIDKYDASIPAKWQPKLTEVGHTAESLKVRGNEAMGRCNYREAIIEYSHALGQSPSGEEVETIKRNRSLAYLKIRHFEAALCDTGYPNFNTLPAEKTLFRAAEPLYYLGRYSECSEMLEQLLTRFPHNSPGQALLSRARDRYLEQTTGSYKFEQLQAKAQKLRPPQLDLATYVGPTEIRQTKSKGRGLFTTKAVKAGDILLCEKAFASTYANEDKAGENQWDSNISLLLNMETGKASFGTQGDLIKQIVQKLYRNPTTATAFTDLYHGTYKGVTTPDIVDTFLVSQIVAFNAFGCPISSQIIHKELPNDKSNDEKSYHSCGMWLRASYINHCCLSTARRAFIGDLMVVRACRDLEPGTEITFWYHSPSSDMTTSRKKLEHWGFACDCSLCVDAKKTSTAVVAERERLIKSIKRAFEGPRGVLVAKVERLLGMLEKTYTRPAQEVPRLLLWDPQLALARVYAAQGNTTKSLDSSAKVLAALGFIFIGADLSSTSFVVVKWGMFMDYLVETFLLVQNAFVTAGAGRDARQADEYARTAYKIIVGEESSFEKVHG